MTPTYTARVERGERLWLVTVPEIQRTTQARSLREVEPMARDLIAVMEQVLPDSFQLVTDVVFPELPRAHWSGRRTFGQLLRRHKPKPLPKPGQQRESLPRWV